MKGLDIYRTKDGFTVARLHYTADPGRATDEWLRKTEKGYPGGRAGMAWRKEMEIDFTAYSGQLLCYDILTRYRHKIIKEVRFDICNYYGSLDWGRNNPASFHVYAVNPQKRIHSAYEIYLRDKSVPDFARLIKAAPQYEGLLWISADPSLWNRNQETKEGLRSLEDMFRENGIILTKGKSRDDTIAINELLDRWDRLDVREPTFTISPRCPKQRWEFERLRYKELTTAMIEKSNPYEQLMDKDNHSWDDFKYFISTWLVIPTVNTEPKPEPHSLAWDEARYSQDESWRSKYER